MGDAAGATVGSDREWAELMDVTEGQIVQEIGWDEDADSGISESLEDVIGLQLLDEDTDEMVDVVLLWWRGEDGDLVDGLVDATRNLGDAGRIWLLTPAAGTDGTVDPGEIAESAQIAGLVQTVSTRLGSWQGACLVASGTKR
ncbi:DUF3052 domain-containing protein [Corynebacterium terpenotabidum]|uniref:DUF3052 domain-containing protein n=1 Tax=Corynebacterium terpenotabidum Y-11 TaxID=1200352 RepID=S4XDB0_9CORY|nr:DUF3052 domain-containing protein [Corynebacterium terpenotabidum]AGP30504.1 hypothetical protein A606_04275 [Corynebacterium terpenotabidum Y-11]